MTEISGAAQEKLDVLSTLGPYLRSRSTSKTGTVYSASMEQYFHLIKAEEELLVIIGICDEVLRA